MRTHRYVGRHRNAGWGYTLPQRIRRDIAFQLGTRGLYRLAYLIDYDRDRYAREYADLEHADLEADR